jgi:hypothetical protein
MSFLDRTKLEEQIKKYAPDILVKGGNKWLNLIQNARRANNWPD